MNDRLALWMEERTAGGWSAPVVLPAPVNSDEPDIHAASAPGGDLYLASRRPGTLGRSDSYQGPASALAVEPRS